MPPKPKTDNTAMRELKQALKAGELGRLYLFHGEEAYLRARRALWTGSSRPSTACP